MKSLHDVFGNDLMGFCKMWGGAMRPVVFDDMVHKISDKDIFPGGDDKPEYVNINDNMDLFDRFVFFVRHYMAELGMYDWRMEFCCTNLGACRHSQVRFSIPDRLAVFALNNEIPEIYATDDYMRKSALHEVLHLMLAEHEVACTGYPDISKDARGELIDNAQHMIINRMVPLLLGGGVCHDTENL